MGGIANAITRKALPKKGLKPIKPKGKLTPYKPEVTKVKMEGEKTKPVGKLTPYKVEEARQK